MKKVVLKTELKTKSQTTVFIIVAILILAVIIGTIYLTQTSTKTNIASVFSKLGIKSSSSIIQSSIIGCLDSTAKDSLITIGIQGGYYNKPEKFSDIGFAVIPYYYYEGEFLQPKNQKIEKELADFVDDNLKFCINNLNFEDFELEYKNSKSESIIKKGEVTFKTDLFMKIKKSELTSEFELKNHAVNIESKLYDILEVATYITDSHKENPELICASCVADIAENRELFVDFLDFTEEKDKSTTLVVISENKTMGEPYIFEFLNKYPV